MPMSQDDEDRFRPRPGRIRSDGRGGAATKSFFTRVRKIARQHGAGPPGASAYRKSGGSGGRARGKVGEAEACDAGAAPPSFAAAPWANADGATVNRAPGVSWSSHARYGLPGRTAAPLLICDIFSATAPRAM